MNAKEKKMVKDAIMEYRNEASGVTRWNYVGAKEVIQMVTSFDDELLHKVESLENSADAFPMEYFANIALFIVATTRSFEQLNDKEISAYNTLIEDVKMLCTESLTNGFDTEMFEKVSYVREIIRVNAVFREDYDCKYRMGMVFPIHEDMCEIIHRVITNWDKLIVAEGFETLFSSYYREWQKSDTCCDIYGGRERAKKFMAILDDCVS
ncbi:MAG: hypothetical protein IJH12_05645 [Clostridia bacterium]|nr:hypothetical protein [Clostridia bacterium]